MQLSVTEREQLYAILEKYDQNPKVQQMREFIQHGDVTTYQHCKNVVLVSCWLNHRLHLGADEISLPDNCSVTEIIVQITDALHAYIPHLSLSKPNKPKISINFPQR